MGFRLNMPRTAYLVELAVFAFIYLYDAYLIDIYQERALNCHFAKLQGKLRTAITGLKVGLEAGSLLQRATGNGKQCRASCGAGAAGGPGWPVTGIVLSPAIAVSLKEPRPNGTAHAAGVPAASG